MKSHYLIGLFVLFNVTFAQLTPDAATIIDAYMPYGADNMNSYALFPVIPNQGYTPDAPSASFHLSGSVDLYSPGIAALNASGIEYYMFFQWADLETTLGEDIVADDPDINDPLFGVQIKLDGTPNQVSADKYLRSMNRVEWRSFFLKCVQRGITAGASGVILDGAATLHFDSFDPEDLAAFKDFMLTRYDTISLNTAGWAFQTTDYRTWIHDIQGYTDFPQTLDIQGDAPPYARDWLDFKLARNQYTWEVIQDSINAFSERAGRVITLYGNNAYLGDWGEASIYHLLNLADRNLPFYKGQLASEYFLYGDRYPLTGSVTGLVKNGEALGVRSVIWSPPDPEGTDQLAFEQQQHFIAETFAAGGLAQLGAGPGDLSLYLPPYTMVQTQRELLNSVQPHSQAAVILPMATSVREYFLPRAYGTQMLMQEIGVTYNVVVAGNNIDWPDEFSADQLAGYSLVVLPDAPYLTQNQINVLLAYVSGGGNLITFGYSNFPGYVGGLDENNQAMSNPDWEGLVQGASGIRSYGSGHVYLLEVQAGATGNNMGHYWNLRNSVDPGEVAIADAIRDAVAGVLPDLGILPDIRRDNMDRKIEVFRHDNASEDAMLVHFVNGDVDANTLLHSTEENLTVNLSLPPNFTGNTASVSFYNPENPDGSSPIDVTVQGDSVTLTIPSIFIWTMAYVQEQIGPPSLALDHLIVSNATNNYRLKSDQVPEFAWDVVVGTQFSCQVQIWANAMYDGDPLYDTGVVQSSDGYFQPTDWVPVTGQSYMVRVRIGNSTGDYSDWRTTGFHNNLPPEVPSQPWIYDRLTGDFYAGIFTGAIRDTFPIFKFIPGGDGEADSLRYLVEIWTDSLLEISTDSSGLTPVFTQLGDETYSIVGNGDFLFDTLTTNLDIDNYGMWWRVRSFDGLDTSATASNWARFTWDHINDPPNPFDLTSPEDGLLTNLNVSFQWNFEGDSDPSSQWLSGADLYLAEDADFTVNPEILENAGQEVNQSPHIDYPGNLPNHKHLFWKVLVHDQNGGSRFSNQIWSIYADDGSNNAPGSPVLEPNPEMMTLNDALAWNSPVDLENDELFYELQIATTSDFADILISVDEITGGTGPMLNRPGTGAKRDANFTPVSPAGMIKLTRVETANEKLKTGKNTKATEKDFGSLAAKVKPLSGRKSVAKALSSDSKILSTIDAKNSPESVAVNREIISYPLDSLVAMLEHGVTYYWRVRAYDRFGGDSGFSGSVGEFALNGIPVGNFSAPLTMEEDVSGNVISSLNVIFTDPDADALSFAITQVSTGLDSAIVISNADSTGLWVYLTENANGDSAWVEMLVSDPYGAAITARLYINITPVNDAPSDFALIAPTPDSSIIFTDENLTESLHFSWETAADVEDDPVHYAVSLAAGDTVLLDTVVSVNSLEITYADLNARLEAISVTTFHGEWTVEASDSGLSTMANNGPFAINLTSEVSSGLEPEIPLEFALQQNYPNPFNPITTLEYAIPEPVQVNISVFDLRGQVVRTLVNQSLTAGYWSVQWNGTDNYGRSVSSGIYLYRINAGSFTATKKLMFLK